MTDCKECDKVMYSVFGDVGCPILKDWLTREERKGGKKILDKCPKNKGEK